MPMMGVSCPIDEKNGRMFTVIDTDSTRYLETINKENGAVIYQQGLFPAPELLELEYL
jgi:hypothetical protein